MLVSRNSRFEPTSAPQTREWAKQKSSFTSYFLVPSHHENLSFLLSWHPTNVLVLIKKSLPGIQHQTWFGSVEMIARHEHKQQKVNHIVWDGRHAWVNIGRTCNPWVVMSAPK
jgi:hypothetical protein